jgi:hypothetical protein
MKANRSLVTVVVAVLALGCPDRGNSAGSNPGTGFVPADVTSKVDNGWFPLTPGTSLTYEGMKDGKRAVRVLAVTGKTEVVDGVTCVVVEETLSLGGSLAEKALTYFAQDQLGNVWNFGEVWQEIEHGRVVKTEDWSAGADGAPPAFFMEAAPAIGHAFAHEYTDSNFEVVSLAESVKVPYGAFTDVLLVKEWSPEEPDVLTHKYYVRGLGEVRDVTVEGPLEEFGLVGVTR